MTTQPVQHLLTPVKRTVLRLVKEFDTISQDRIKVLNELAAYISYQTKEGNAVNLVFICTHNSRRSHIAQIWAKAASYFYGIENVMCFSGGAETTAFSQQAVSALKDSGFSIVKIKEGVNPLFSVMYGEETTPLKIFSKHFNHSENPSQDFAAIMTCSHADQNCPAIPGASLRLTISYSDPKAFDNSPGESQKYMDATDQIGCEMLYVFSQVR